MTEQLSAPPVLSTPETHIFEDDTPVLKPLHSSPFSDEELFRVYEVARTVREIQEGGWTRIALQFPDSMLHDAPRVSQELEKELKATASTKARTKTEDEKSSDSLETDFNKLSTTTKPERERLYILADTSYGACCVDEIAAEHVDAQVVVHYGRSCLSPTARLPVIYVFTSRPLFISPLVSIFENTYPSKDSPIILMADITYNSHTSTVAEKLRESGYTKLLVPEVVHDPGSAIPNRKIDTTLDIKECSLFHISDPPPSLLLTLSSRVKDLHIYPTDSETEPTSALEVRTARTLGRRYGILTSLSTCGVFGILINTLSVKNYLPVIETLRSQIAAAGKKSYTFVVGKVNAAKIANFSEIGGWVVVGCWESALIESTEFYRPIITPFELGLALMGDEERVWSGEWRSDFSYVLNNPPPKVSSLPDTPPPKEKTNKEAKVHEHIDISPDNEDEDEDDESAPPEFDLRTGRYVSHSRPMRNTPAQTNSTARSQDDAAASSQELTRRARGDLATVNGVASPGAEFLRTQRVWQGLGSDFHEEDGTSTIEEGRSGVARGYTVGEGEERR
ncbi:diphthamide biosynthesis protein 2 [Phlyctema vagabunda]|uniref:2-(3-amino-3-carboxypropyl)histidine synthase subunit 2 n=1 Tax=Phlyctema vagabunda TaxID=108571 RepID=A0ABR4PCC6_9HELO